MSVQDLHAAAQGTADALDQLRPLITTTVERSQLPERASTVAALVKTYQECRSKASPVAKDRLSPQQFEALRQEWGILDRAVRQWQARIEHVAEVQSALDAFDAECGAEAGIQRKAVLNLLSESDTDATVSWMAEHSGRYRLLAASVPNGQPVDEDRMADSREADGPCDGFRWRDLGVLIEDALRSGSWRMVDLIWREGTLCKYGLRLMSYADLGEALGDTLAADDAYQSKCRDANAYFAKHGIPWEVGVNRKAVVLRPVPRAHPSHIPSPSA
jgi:hypothetical protein